MSNVTSFSSRPEGLRPQLGPPVPPTWLGEPLVLDSRGRAARVSDDRHIIDLIRSVLFTEPGERVNRPDFGCALKTMIFLPNHEALVAATTTLVQAALQQWLADRIVVDRVDVQSVDSDLQVTIVFRRLDDGMPQQVTVAQTVGRPGQ
jgi:uncharacterized protein